MANGPVFLCATVSIRSSADATRVLKRQHKTDMAPDVYTLSDSHTAAALWRICDFRKGANTPAF